MDILLTMPRWMVERIVAILDNDPYTGAKEITETIRKQVEF